jgi:hypothetical protein
MVDWSSDHFAFVFAVADAFGGMKGIFLPQYG